MEEAKAYRLYFDEA